MKVECYGITVETDLSLKLYLIKEKRDKVKEERENARDRMNKNEREQKNSK